MNLFFDEHLELLRSLINHNVDFILIGGYAVIYHGYDRTTGDMDIWLKTGNENRDKLIGALQEFGILHSDIMQLKHMDFTEPVAAFSIGEAPRRIDFITLISNVSFEEASGKTENFTVADLNIPIIHYNHLILSKLTSGRLKDKADIEELERINNYRKKK